MQIDATGIEGVLLIRPEMFSDPRGVFLEVFSQPAFTEAAGHRLTVDQVNCSTSRRGTIRGLHAIAPPPGQARYVTCVGGAVLDIAVDIRVGSPTFGETFSAVLDEDARHALYLAEGLAHGFAPLTDQATVVYLCSSVYSPAKTINIDPLDPDLALDWRQSAPVLSDKDRAAPGLREAAARGLLPAYAECRARYERLRRDVAATGGPR
ncbi:dTDP-4-dehydrorhamnose 3,5-epimerase family protein [Spirillospora sp. NPDC127200]